MKSVEEKIIEVLDELEKWESRKVKVKERYARGDADKTEIERINEQVTHYKNLLSDMKKKMNSTDISRTIARSGN
jgi:translation initiation factor 1 (eIF-1/SUI1)